MPARCILPVAILPISPHQRARLGLAPLIRQEIWHCLGLLKQAGQAILVIDKHVQALTALADRHYIIEKGRVVWTGSTAALQAQPGLQQRYLGV